MRVYVTEAKSHFYSFIRSRPDSRPPSELESRYGIPRSTSEYLAQVSSASGYYPRKWIRI